MVNFFLGGGYCATRISKSRVYGAGFPCKMRGLVLGVKIQKFWILSFAEILAKNNAENAKLGAYEHRIQGKLVI